MSSLLDPEIVNTVQSAEDTADNINDITIGISCMANEEFYHWVMSEIGHISNVVIDRYDLSDNEGVGTGRVLAKRRYDGQDNILQVDSHTLFTSGWDSILTSLWDECLEETNNDKTIITSYLPRYKRTADGLFVDNGLARYNVFTNNHPEFPHNMVAWVDVPVNGFPFEVRQKFLPALKIGTHFVFSDHHFVDSNSVPANVKFFDEEMVQSIELISSGFAMASPTGALPLYHHYYPDQDGLKRQANPFSNYEITQEWQAYLDNPQNRWKCEIWNEYAGIDVFNNTFKEWYIPSSYGVLNGTL